MGLQGIKNLNIHTFIIGLSFLIAHEETGIEISYLLNRIEKLLRIVVVVLIVLWGECQGFHGTGVNCHGF